MSRYELPVLFGEAAKGQAVLLVTLQTVNRTEVIIISGPFFRFQGRTKLIEKVQMEQTES